MPVIHSLLLIYIHLLLASCLSFGSCSSCHATWPAFVILLVLFICFTLIFNSFLLVIHWCLSINLSNSCSSSCLGWSFSPCLLCGLYSLCLICAHSEVCACLVIYPTYWLYSGCLAVWFIFTIQFMLIT